MNRRIAIISIVILALLIAGAWLLRPAQSAPLESSLTVAEALGAPAEGYLRAEEPRRFAFPADHGPHEGFRTEWWYYTGNLDTADGRHFGFQLTFFRNALTPEPVDRDSAWATRNVYMAHFALTDVDGERFWAFERYSRDGAGLAGGQAEPFRVWTESWEAAGDPSSGTRLRAADGDVAIDLVARSLKPPVLQGDAGLSQKSAEAGNASYYYSLTRMQTSGTITIANESFEVSGLSWKDREWSTSALGEGQVGWDWFALQLDDGSELMYYQLRRSDGSLDPYSAGTQVIKDGTKTALSRDDVRLEVLDTWRSPRSGAEYPARWRLSIPQRSVELEIEPLLADQELPLTVVYWEGAVSFSGTVDGKPVRGTGYIEMTGYGEQQRSAVPNRGTQ